MHQIPCSNCQFFTGDYQLKCALHPNTALSEEAIDCSDFCPQAICFSGDSQSIAQFDKYRVEKFSN